MPCFDNTALISVAAQVVTFTVVNFELCPGADAIIVCEPSAMLTMLHLPVLSASESSPLPDTNVGMVLSVAPAIWLPPEYMVPVVIEFAGVNAVMDVIVARTAPVIPFFILTSMVLWLVKLEKIYVSVSGVYVGEVVNIFTMSVAPKLPK